MSRAFQRDATSNTTVPMQPVTSVEGSGRLATVAVTVTVPVLSVVIGMVFGTGNVTSERLVAAGMKEIVIGPAGVPGAMLKETRPSPTVTPDPKVLPEPITEKRSEAEIVGGVVVVPTEMFAADQSEAVEDVRGRRGADGDIGEADVVGRTHEFKGERADRDGARTGVGQRDIECVVRAAGSRGDRLNACDERRGGRSARQQHRRDDDGGDNEPRP